MNFCVRYNCLLFIVSSFMILLPCWCFRKAFNVCWRFTNSCNFAQSIYRITTFFNTFPDIIGYKRASFHIDSINCHCFISSHIWILQISRSHKLNKTAQKLILERLCYVLCQKLLYHLRPGVLKLSYLTNKACINMHNCCGWIPVMAVCYHQPKNLIRLGLPFLFLVRNFYTCVCHVGVG